MSFRGLPEGQCALASGSVVELRGPVGTLNVYDETGSPLGELLVKVLSESVRAQLIWSVPVFAGGDVFPPGRALRFEHEARLRFLDDVEIEVLAPEAFAGGRQHIAPEAPVVFRMPRGQQVWAMSVPALAGGCTMVAPGEEPPARTGSTAPWYRRGAVWGVVAVVAAAGTAAWLALRRRKR